MKRFLILAAALGLALGPPAMAQLYKYTDKNGKTVYSDQPPPDQDSKQIRVQSAGPSDAPGKTSVQKDKDADKGRKEAAKGAEKAEKDAARQAQIQARCNHLKADLAGYEGGVRLQRVNEKGEREFMTDEQIEQAKSRTRREMDEACSQK